MPSARIEIVDRQSIFAFPFQLHPAFIPHLVLIGVIVLASAADFVMTTISWLSGA